VASAPALAPPVIDRDLALRTVYERDYRRLVDMARLLLDRERDAEEVVQDAFVRVWASWPRVRDKEHPAGYVRMTVVNLARSGLRRRVLERVSRSRTFVALEPNASQSLSAEQLSEDLERDRGVQAAVHQLPRRQREAVVLRYFEDLSTAETAAAMGCSPGAVKAYLSRGLATLRGSLEEP
jgi:RNA polymerase sigma-70 factor (sigma-E family)